MNVAKSLLREFSDLLRIKVRRLVRAWNYDRDNKEFDAALKSVVFLPTDRHVCNEPESPGFMWALTLLYPHGSITSGVFSTFEEAQTAVLTNGDWLWEYSYSLAVIERIRYGIQIPQLESYWYAWDLERGAYHAIHQPAAYEYLVGWLDLRGR